MLFNYMKRKFFEKNGDVVTIFHISDTHNKHRLLNVPQNVDIIIHSGDESNSIDERENEKEFLDFIEWYGSLPIKTKILVGGNHSVFISKNKEYVKNITKTKNIIYLEHSGYYHIDSGLYFWGDPSINLKNNKWVFEHSQKYIYKLMDKVPNDTDVLITHQPPKGTLDLGGDKYHGFLPQGNKHVYNKCVNVNNNIFLSLFGHMHDNSTLRNYGVLYRDGVTFVNSSCCKDGEGVPLVNKGHIITIDKKNKNILNIHSI